MKRPDLEATQAWIDARDMRPPPNTSVRTLVAYARHLEQKLAAHHCINDYDVFCDDCGCSATILWKEKPVYIGVTCPICKEHEEK